ncbi:MAG: aminotransferase class IV [Eubacteriales bacterium]|nr:aminotransferase class IV [Eubacteriales bacterium]
MQIHADDGYFFGLSVFETIGMKHGHPLFLKEHLERMNASAKALGICREVTKDMVFSWLASAPQNLFQHGALKIMLSAENLLFLPRENHYEEAQYQKGFTVDYSQVRRNETSPLVRHKTANYGDCILEKRASAAQGLDERIFRNTRGEITEGTVSNIFFIKNGKLFTPSVSCGLLPGIIRRYLLEQENARETVLYPEQAAEYDECFLTNSLMGIMPVKSLDGHLFSRREKTEQIRQHYQEYCRIFEKHDP